MSKTIDMTGRKFGKLLVLNRIPPKPGRAVHWNTVCDCGNSSVVDGSYLRSGHTRSCGCLCIDFEDLVGKIFGRWTIIRRSANYNGKIAWDAKCSCGTERVVLGESLKKGTSKSCGCLSVDTATTHGESRQDWRPASAEYKTWHSVKDRTSRSNSIIKMCDRWSTSFENFLSDMGRKPGPEYTIDRINNEDGYHPGNCRWATKKEQDRNRRSTRWITYDGRTKTMAEWEKEFGLNRGNLSGRLRMGWELEKALKEPIKHIKIRPPGLSLRFHSEYVSYVSMRGRCNNSKSRNYSNYGGRGITICDRWTSFENFLSDMGPKPHPAKSYSLDRIDSDKSYFPENCRWATTSEQNFNKRSNRLVEFRGETRPVTEWVRILNLESSLKLKVDTIFGRLYCGWSVDRAFTTHCRATRRSA